MGRSVEIKKYKSERDFEKDAEKMLRRGWHIDGQSTRTKNWRLLTGPFTNKGITTVTWIKDPPEATPVGRSSRTPSTAQTPAASAHQFSPDGRYWWNGNIWSPAISEDGQQRWDGQQWIRISGPTEDGSNVPVGAGLDAGGSVANPATDVASTLRQLAELRDQGLLTPTEYEAKRAEVLARL